MDRSPNPIFGSDNLKDEVQRVADDLYKRLQDLRVLIDGLTGGGGPPTGAAGGALDGTYPNPGIAASVAGDGLAESANVLSVNTDGSTIETSGDALRVKDGGITSAKIADGTIVDADISGSAAIDASKIGAGGVTSTEFGYIGTLTSDAQTQINSRVADTGDTMTGPLLLPDGSAGTPALANDGDANTGIFFGAADQVDVSTGGTSRVQLGTTAEIHTLPIRGQNGSASAPAVSFSGDTDTGFYRVAADQAGIAAGGSVGLTVTTTAITPASTRQITTPGGININSRFVLNPTTVSMTTPGGGDPVLDADINSSVETFTVDDATLFANALITPRTIAIGSELMLIAPSGVTGNTVTVVDRGMFGTTAAAHLTSDAAYDYGNNAYVASPYDNLVLPHNAIRLACPDALSGNVAIWLPPLVDYGGWLAPTKAQRYTVAFSDMAGFTADFYVGGSVTDIGSLTPVFSITSANGGGIEFDFDLNNLAYVPNSSHEE